MEARDSDIDKDALADGAAPGFEISGWNSICFSDFRIVPPTSNPNKMPKVTRTQPRCVRRQMRSHSIAQKRDRTGTPLREVWTGSVAGQVCPRDVLDRRTKKNGNAGWGRSMCASSRMKEGKVL